MHQMVKAVQAVAVAVAVLVLVQVATDVFYFIIRR